jgi:16S rRNA (cytosine967-C5)-methyltransferase
VNTRRASVDQYRQLLAQRGIEATARGAGAVQLARPMPVDKLPGFAEGKVSVQDAGAQQAAQLLDVADGMRVLDACSAPGGKAAHLLERADLDLVALDSDPERLQKVAQNFARLHLSAQLLAGDAAQPGQWWDGRPFQRILADVPCSASGVVRRHPDIKWLRRESDLQQFAAQQRGILDALWRCLARGGKLLYATCSVFAEENGLQIAAFLARHEDARRMPLTGLESMEGQLIPDPLHDGFYYALLAKA